MEWALERLPDLAFGNATGELINGRLEASEAMAAILPTMTYLDSSNTKEFLTKTAKQKFGGLGLMASSVLPCEMKVEDSLGWHLAIPYFGAADIKVEGKTIRLAGGQNALLLPNVRRETDNGTRSVVIASLDIDRLRDTIASMAGRETPVTELDDRPHEIDLREQRQLFPAFQRMCALVDSVADNAQFAEYLGIEDLFYRWTSFALGSRLKEVEPAYDPVSERHRLDVVCDLVQTTGERPVTLTDMEKISGLSARSLQYAFKHRFGCSPMEWQRRERIQLARNRLIAAVSGETITDIAYAVGFASSGAFATQYKRYFGETPSETLRLASLTNKALRKRVS